MKLLDVNSSKLVNSFFDSDVQGSPATLEFSLKDVRSQLTPTYLEGPTMDGPPPVIGAGRVMVVGDRGKGDTPASTDGLVVMGDVNEILTGPDLGDVFTTNPVTASSYVLGDDLAFVVLSTLGRDIGDAVEHEHRRQGQLRIAGAE